MLFKILSGFKFIATSDAFIVFFSSVWNMHVCSLRVYGVKMIDHIANNDMVFGLNVEFRVYFLCFEIGTNEWMVFRRCDIWYGSSDELSTMIILNECCSAHVTTIRSPFNMIHFHVFLIVLHSLITKFHNVFLIFSWCIDACAV